MRLIDADKLIQELEKNKTFESDEYTEGVNTGISWCAEDVVDAPTVDAIPIEWIEEYRQNREDYADEYNAKAVLKRLLETWEKENET